MTLDPDDPRPPYQQVAAHLRAAILTKKFAPGDKLPSGPSLSQTYGVARQTVQQALRVLRDEGLIVSRQGSGVFVRARTERPVGLRPHVEQAFEADDVRIDFAGFTGETLAGALTEPLDRIREGRMRPSSITLRLLIPDTSRPWAIPCRAEDLSDSPSFRARSERITDRSLSVMRDALEELQDLGLVPQTSFEVRAHGAAPLFKIYIINGIEAFFGFYPIGEHKITLDGERETIYDLTGKDTILFHQARDDDTGGTGSQYLDQAQRWFDSMWETVAREPVR